jgi:hypothetical protein
LKECPVPRFEMLLWPRLTEIEGSEGFCKLPFNPCDGNFASPSSRFLGIPSLFHLDGEHEWPFIRFWPRIPQRRISKFSSWHGYLKNDPSFFGRRVDLAIICLGGQATHCKN